MSSFLAYWFTFLLFLTVEKVWGQDCGVYHSLKADLHPEFAESANSLQAQWVSKDTILVIGSSVTSNNNPTKVWLGSPQQSTGLYQFTKHNGITEPVNTQSLQISRNGWNIAVVVAETKRSIYVSSDGGTNWSKHDLPGSYFNPLTDLVMSTVNPQHMAFQSQGNLYFTYNSGATWSQIGNNVNIFYLLNTSSTNEFVFFSTTSSNGKINPLYRYNVQSKAKELIDGTAYRFFVDNNYLFVSRQNITASGTDNRSRRFYVSTNYGQSHVTFNEVQLPAANWEDYVVVMATHEAGAFIHISKANDKEKGQLFVSDKSGVVFSLSLDGHLYQIVSFGLTLITVNDFYEVNSMRGVYITTEINSGNHYSVITFNNGASWQRITPPSGTNCHVSDGCSLHLHVSYSRAVNASFTTHPLSVSNAVGIVIAHGSLGKSRDYNPTHSKIFVSNDGGYTWMMHNNLTGIFSYGIADYGNIIAIVSNSQYTKTLWFSHDRGSCFKSVEFDTTGYFKVTKGLLMDPQGLGLYAFALGLEGNFSNDNWRLIAVDFKSILQSPCHSKDYISLLEHNISSTCILGYRRQFQITKPTSLCYNDNDYSPNPKIIKCNCTYTDMECDYGYKVSSSTANHLKCTAMDQFNLSSVCPPGQDTYSQSVHGYRLIAGDLCSQTSQSRELLKRKQSRCTGHENNSGFNTNTNTKSASSTAMKVLGVMIFIVAVLLAGAVGVYCVVHFKSKSRTTGFNDRVMYKRIPLTEQGDSPNEQSSASSSDEDLLRN